MFLTNVPIEPPKLIEYLQPRTNETKIEIQIEPEVQEERELTLQEKIDSNFYNCDESTHYIRADNAECLAKPVQAPQATSSTQTVTNTSQAPKATRTGSTAPRGWYSYGWCTYYVSTQRPVGQWNNARDWAWQARRDGWATGSTPRVGAIAQKANHVAIVRSVSGNQITIQEMNYVQFGVISSRTIPSDGWSFIY